MKNLVILTTILTLFVACSNNTTNTQTTIDSTNVETVITDSLSTEMDSINGEICNDSII
jgi:hypothetical protein